ncbi:carbonic anhydrase [Chelatococcus reniformis]|uniref:Carbonic anhydrase n=1 Tax=Chelatococcus reniformis TaxID=1494448 RepID=A0A916X795_9HYPH|nr:carbonic anhydrase [Chelatococcus reniformis]GGC50477.1 carbonic anhydrase [Chelatococcus reniformis]
MARALISSDFPAQLTQGYRAFLDSRFPGERRRFEILAERGQSPEVMIIGCCDSRVSPEVIFDASPGEMFVVRNVANLVPPFETGGDYHGTSAALEFAVQALKVKHIVVLGHQSCGGIKAFANKADPLSPGDFIGSWMTLIAPAAERLDESLTDAQRTAADYVTRLELAAIELSLRNLLTFPCVRTLVERGQLALHGAYFGVANGVLMIRDPQTGAFAPAVEGSATSPGQAMRWS